MVFYSPLFWILGNNLNTYNKIEKSDSIVVFSGNDKNIRSGLSKLSFKGKKIIR